MQAVVVTGAGRTPSGGEFKEPDPGTGRRVFELVGAGLHQIVRSRASGRHYSSAGQQYPLVPGVDAVARTPEGALVYTGWVRAPWGTMAERMAAPVGLPLPEAADPLAVAAGTNPGMAGWLPLDARQRELGDLGTVLVLGATGASGRMATETALALNATKVVAAGRNTAVLDELAATDERVVRAPLTNDPEADADTLAHALDGQSPSTVLDFVYGPVAEAAFAALNTQPLDRDADIAYIQIGSLGGEHARVPSSLLRSRRITVRGSGIGAASEEQILAVIPRVIAAIADSSLTVSYRAFPIAEAGQAWGYQGPERVVIVP